MNPNKTAEFLPRIATVGRSHYEPSKTEKKLDALSRLKDGWHFGRGKGPSSQIVAKARSMVRFAESVSLLVDVFPGKGGEITVAIYFEDIDHSFQVQRNLVVRYWNETDPEGDVVDLTDEGVYKAIFKLSSTAAAWNSFFTFILNTGITLENTFEARPLRIQAMGAECPSLITLASKREAVVYAVMHENITRPSAPNLQFSGRSKNQFCQLVIA